MFEFMTREVFDALIIAVIVIGGALAAVRLYRDFTRPLPRSMSPPDDTGGLDDGYNDDTQPNPTTPGGTGKSAKKRRRKSKS